MSAGTRLFLLLGCIVVIALEAPTTLTGLLAAWRGPYDVAGQAVGRAFGAEDEELARAAPLYGPPAPAAAGRQRLARR